MECHSWTSKPWKEHKYPEIQPTNLCGVCSGYGIVGRIGFRPCVRNRSMGGKRETHIRCRQQTALLPESLRRRLHRFGKCGCWHCSAASAASAAKTCKNPWIESINCTTSGPPSPSIAKHNPYKAESTNYMVRTCRGHVTPCPTYSPAGKRKTRMVMSTRFSLCEFPSHVEVL